MQFRQQEVVIVRRARRRSLTIKVSAHSPVRVLVSMGVSARDIEKILVERWDWVLGHQAKLNQEPEPLKVHALQGQVWPLFAENWLVKEQPTPLRKIFCVFQNHELQIYWPLSRWDQKERLRAQAQKAVHEALLDYALGVFSERVNYWSLQMGLVPKQVQLMRGKSRWGSCSSQGLVRINYRLIFSPVSVIDSVVIHELAHLVHLNHSDKFWTLVFSFCPTYADSKKWLRLNSFRMPELSFSEVRSPGLRTGSN